MAKHQTFNKLVDSETDFVGMVAYTIYKNEKINWIESFKAQFNNEPTQEQIETGFNLASDSPAKVAQYRTLATERVNQFIDVTLGEEIQNFTSNLQQTTLINSVDTTLSQITTKVDSIKKRDGSDVWFAIWTGVVATLIVAGISILVWLVNLKNDPEYAKYVLDQAKARAAAAVQ